MARFTVHRSIAAPMDVVFDVLSDHRGYTDVSVFRSATLEREGKPVPDGVGAIRALKVVGPTMREEVTAFERPTLMEYQALSGIPARSHSASIKLGVEGTGTFLSYSVDSVPKLPMPPAAWATLLRPGFKRLVGDIAKEAERRARADAQPTQPDEPPRRTTART